MACVVIGETDLAMITMLRVRIVASVSSLAIIFPECYSSLVDYPFSSLSGT